MINEKTVFVISGTTICTSSSFFNNHCKYVLINAEAALVSNFLSYPSKYLNNAKSVISLLITLRSVRTYIQLLFVL